MDEQEFEQMKQNAQKAAQAYQAKSRPHDASPEPPVNQQPDPPASASPTEKERKQGGLLAALMKDRDKTMILALILLLMDEGGDYDLLLALLYLLM